MKHNIILVLSAPKLAAWHFFVFARHAGVFRFNHGRADRPRPPLLSRDLTRFDYEATPFLEAGKHKQLVELRSARLECQLEAATLPRPHSRHGGVTWRWVCPECGARAPELRLALSGGADTFRCGACLKEPSRARCELNGTFLVLPPKLPGNVVPFKAARPQAILIQ